MNYRHAFHAGNFADVLKHAVLALVIEHLKRKPAAFRFIDTHAGRGHYRLDAPEAERTREWRAGIGRLIGPGATALPQVISPLLAPYLGEVRRHNSGGALVSYPGSPVLALGLMRPGDALIANELHPEDGRVLKAALSHDVRAKVLGIDAWQALKALLPPKERRGLVLVDPPFEDAGDLERLATGLSAAVRRFATGIYILWFPIKDGAVVDRLRRSLSPAVAGNLIVAELRVSALASAEKLAGCGLAIVNPPFMLADQLNLLLPFLAEWLSQGPGASGTLHRQ